MEKEYPDVRDLSTLLPIEAAFVKALAKAEHVYDGTELSSTRSDHYVS